jgi:hypothetical protein
MQETVQGAFAQAAKPYISKKEDVPEMGHIYPWGPE